MKSCTLHFLVIAIAISNGVLAQETNPEILAKKLKNARLVIVDQPTDGRAFEAYHVEERINSKFGSQVITYDVPSLDMIYTHDLGPNNSRVVTLKYSKPKIKANVTVAVVPVNQSESSHGQPLTEIEATTVTEPTVAEILPEETKVVDTLHSAKKQFALINFTDTYERILMKGYKSVDMLKRVANSRFFDGKFENAARWYSELFALTDDLDEAFYYRYAQALKSISQTEKANEMMALFENKIAKN